MSEWNELEPDPKTVAATAPVRFGLSKTGRHAKSRAKGVVLIRKTIVQQLGMTNWRVRIRVGKGGRAHQIAIVPDAQGPFELAEVGVAKGGGVFRVRLPMVEAWPDKAVPPAERSFKVETEGKTKILVIALPPYCWDANARRLLMAKAAA